jgi:hypothetical protein
MDTKEQIAKALALLSPPSNQRTECERDISLALDRVERAATFAQSCRAARSKKKSGLTSYYAALRRLLSASRGLDPAVKPWLSFADPAYVTGKALEAEIVKVEALLDRRSSVRGVMRAGARPQWRLRTIYLGGGSTRLR